MQVCFNGTFYAAGSPLFTAHNRSFKYGDGLFETMKVFNSKLLLADLHFERLFISSKILQIQYDAHFTAGQLTEKILKLCQYNNCLLSARIRLAVYRQDDDRASYLIEALPLNDEVNNWNEEGISVVVYPYARKSTDTFSNIKSANYLPYIMAAKYAIEKRVEDALVLNTQNNIADSSKANLFLVKGNALLTPPLHQGCVNGVMRRLIIQELKSIGLKLKQQELTIDDLQTADEVFLTNAIQIIRWVKQYENTTYNCIKSKEIFNQIKAAIF